MNPAQDPKQGGMGEIGKFDRIRIKQVVFHVFNICLADRIYLMPVIFYDGLDVYTGRRRIHKIMEKLPWP